MVHHSGLTGTQLHNPRGIQYADDILDWDSNRWFNSGIIWNGSYWVPKSSSNTSEGGSATLDELTDTNLTTPASGETLVYKADDEKWENELPSLTYNVANVILYSGQYLSMARYSTSECTYIWQASVCNSGGASVSGLNIELLCNDTSVYKTSSAILQKGYPLDKAQPGEIEIRIMHSGGHTYGSQEHQLEYGMGFMQVSVY